jgi:hypothetical protein
MPEPHGFTVLAHEEVADVRPQRYSRNRSSFYADPVAWLMDAAITRAVDAAGDRRPPADHTGVVVVSAHATLGTMRSVARAASRGRVSPLEFAGANPGSLVSIACISRGLRGPTLLLTMEPDDGLAVASTVAAGWLRAGRAAAVVVGTHAARPAPDDPPGDATDDDGPRYRHVARCALLTAGTGPADGPDLRELLLDAPAIGVRR